MRHLCCDETERRIFASCENSIIVWSVQTGEQLQRLCELHEMAIQAVCYCEHSRHLVTTSHDGTLYRWCFNQATVMLVDSFKGHTKYAPPPPAMHGPHVRLTNPSPPLPRSASDPALAPPSPSPSPRVISPAHPTPAPPVPPVTPPISGSGE